MRNLNEIVAFFYNLRLEKSLNFIINVHHQKSYDYQNLGLFIYFNFMVTIIFLFIEDLNFFIITIYHHPQHHQYFQYLITIMVVNLIIIIHFEFLH